MERKKNAAEFKREAVRLAGQAGVSRAKVAQELGLNVTMRMSMRRFTRLTNAFSKKVENLGYAVALHFMFYNFGRIHQSLRVTPAMEAGLTDHVWSLEEIASLTEQVQSIAV